MSIEDRGFQLFLSTFDEPPGVAANVTTSPVEPSEDFDDTCPDCGEDECDSDCERFEAWVPGRGCVTPRETRDEQVTRFEAEGWLVPGCSGCDEFYSSPKRPTDVFAPSHRVNDWCESGKRPHCTCDRCF